MEIGVRELRNQLSRWIDVAQAGEEIVITERGRPVARLGPADGSTELQRLIAEGLVQPPAARRKPAADLKPVRARGSVSELVRDQRR
jgi:prevent-host-death family protein